MTAQHTKTHLTFRENGEANSYALLDDQGRWFMSLLLNGEQVTARQEANLRRLAACWNACDGIDTAELEHIASTGGMLGPREDVARIAAHRDELLAALQPFVSRNSSAETITITVRTADVEKARAAIAKDSGSPSHG